MWRPCLSEVTLIISVCLSSIIIRAGAAAGEEAIVTIRYSSVPSVDRARHALQLAINVPRTWMKAKMHPAMTACSYQSCVVSVMSSVSV